MISFSILHGVVGFLRKPMKILAELKYVDFLFSYYFTLKTWLTVFYYVFI